MLETAGPLAHADARGRLFIEQHKESILTRSNDGPRTPKNRARTRSDDGRLPLQHFTIGGVGVESDRNLKRTFSKPFASGNLEASPLQCNLTGINFGDGRIETRESPDISACLSTTC